MKIKQKGIELTLRYAYAPGKRYATHVPVRKEEWLEAAKAAERYVAQHRTVQGDTAYWNDEISSGVGYADGSSGILYFYMSMYRATGERAYWDIAAAAGDYILDHWDGEPEPSDGSQLEGFGCAIGNVLISAFHFFEDERYAAAARSFAHRYIESAHQGEHGLYWTGNTAWAKDGNIVLFLLNTASALNDGSIRAAAISAGEQYLSEGETQPDGHVVFDGKLGGVAVWEGISFNQNYNMPNWEFGAAGSGFTLLKLYQFTSDPRYLEIARDQARYLRSVSVAQTKGVLIPRTLDPAERDVFYLGHCHGVAGTGKFLYELYRVTEDHQYLDFIVDLADGIESMGAPEHQSKGLWNIETLCCGHAGIAHFFLGLYLAQGEPRWLELAKRAGYVMLGMKEDLPDHAADWPIAFWRVKPEEITRPYSLFRGAAGIGMVLAELYMEETGNYRFDRLIDDPFPESWNGVQASL